MQSPRAERGGESCPSPNPEAISTWHLLDEEKFISPVEFH